MLSALFIAEYPQDVQFVIEACCYEHGYCNGRRMQQPTSLATALHQINAGDTVYFFVAFCVQSPHWTGYHPVRYISHEKYYFLVQFLWVCRVLLIPT